MTNPFEVITNPFELMTNPFELITNPFELITNSFGFLIRWKGLAHVRVLYTYHIVLPLSFSGHRRFVSSFCDRNKAT